MAKDIESLDLTNEYDILYFYRNISSYPSSLDRLAALRLSDINMCMLCYGHVEAGVLAELGEETVDRELEYLCGEDNGSKDKKDGAAVANDQLVIGDATNDEKFHVNNLGTLLRPFLGVCNKQLVDIIFYVFRIQGVNHFDLLFEEFGTAKDLLIELHLLVVRGSKCKSFDLQDIRETLSAAAEPDCTYDDASLDKNSEKLNFFTSSSEETKEEIEVGSFTEEKELDYNVRPFIVSKHVNPLVHLDQAKKLLINMVPKDQTFFIENVSTYLSLRFDRALFLSFIGVSFNRHFYHCLNKFSSPPFFLFKDADIKELLNDSSRRLSRMRTSSGPALLCLPRADDGESIKNIDSGFSLYKHILVCNCYTLKYFLEFCISTFDNISSSIDNYLLISKNLRFFVAEYRHPALFVILEYLINNRIDRIQREIKENLLADADLYVDVYYRRRDEPKRENYEGDTVASDDDKARFLEEWKLVYPGNDLFPNGTAVPCLPHTPSLADSEDSLVQAFVNPVLHRHFEKEVSAFLLDSYLERERLAGDRTYNQSHRNSILNACFIKVSADKLLKGILLEHAGIISRMEDEAKTKILENLQNLAGTKWRYRARLLDNIDLLVEQGIPREWFMEAFRNDRVYIIRQMARRIFGVNVDDK